MSCVNGNTRILPQLLQFDLPAAAEAALERLLGIRELLAIYKQIQHTEGSLFSGLLRELRVSACVSARELAHIPTTGSTVVVANHPFGLLDGALLTSTVMQTRSDVKVLANESLQFIPQLWETLIPVNVHGTVPGGNARAVRTAIEHLRRGGLLIVFPAGAVARSAEAPWSASVSRMIELTSRNGARIAIVPAHVRGSNSLHFRVAARLHERVGTALLARELLNKRGRAVEVRFGRPVSTEALRAFATDQERIDYLRWRSDLLGVRHTFKPATKLRVFAAKAEQPHETIAPAVAAELLRSEVESLGMPIVASGEMAAYIAAASRIPCILHEIGRLREISFRAAGEGTGKPLDLDRFDEQYLHLFVWNRQTNEVAGAYRLKVCDRVDAMYTATLFRYGRDFLDRLGPAIELGRSFVRPEYQRTLTPLLLLWKAICRYVAEHPEHKVLFGPVSISNSYSATSRELIVSFLEQRSLLKDMARLVRARNPFRRSRTALEARPPDLDHLSDAVADIEAAGPGIPVLLRQYLKLGGRLIGFNVDPNFGQALDGLIVVDLTRTEPRLLERYFGKEEAERFLAFHRG